MTETVRLIALALRLVAGRRWWIAPLLPLAWPGFVAFQLLVGWLEESPSAASAQGVLIGFPLAVLAVALGVRVIAGELDQRTLEIAYTVPGGAVRVWLAKLSAATFLLLLAELLLAVAVFTVFTSFPAGALLGALESALFYLAAATGLAALFRSEITGALASAALLGLNGLLTGFGDLQTRVSPFFNPLAVDDVSEATVRAWTVQNRIGVALATAALVALAVRRAENRERMLG